MEVRDEETHPQPFAQLRLKLPAHQSRLLQRGQELLLLLPCVLALLLQPLKVITRRRDVFLLVVLHRSGMGRILDMRWNDVKVRWRIGLTLGTSNSKGKRRRHDQHRDSLEREALLSKELK
jgi:hypothetical protein